jgi:hypothetical protein
MSLYRSRGPRDFDPNLTQPAQSGIYFVGSDDLTGCAGKDGLLRRLSVSLELPTGFGDNWDALADSLRDLRWMPAWGYVLLFDHADDLRLAAPADFDILLGILDDAATFACDNDMPWFAFLALPDAEPDATP